MPINIAGEPPFPLCGGAITSNDSATPRLKLSIERGAKAPSALAGEDPESDVK
jgi:hypothetical protein